MDKKIELIGHMITNTSANLMNMRKHLEDIFPKKNIDFVMGPAHYRIKHGDSTIIVVNAKYADNPDLVVGELAIGLEG